MIDLLLAAFAAYRCANMFALEDGPFDVFAAIRARIDPEQQTWIGRGLNCPLCIGVWVSLVCALVIQPQSITQFFLMWFGIAGAQVFLQKVTE